MSEKKESGWTDAQRKLARQLKAIGVDLWGDPDQETDPMAAFLKTAEQAKAAEGKQTAEEKPAAEISDGKAAMKDGETLPEKQPREEEGMERLWVTADETVDWTEALAFSRPRDGLTGQKRWSFYHRLAPRVLKGEIAAYAEALKTINPLGDLTDYVKGMVIKTPSADRLECVFQCRPDYLRKNGEEYLGGLGIRIARDLLAALPVDEVRVTGNEGEEERLEVTFRREQLTRRRMAFLDPAAFTRECGGSIRTESAKQ